MPLNVLTNATHRVRAVSSLALSAKGAAARDSGRWPDPRCYPRLLCI